MADRKDPLDASLEARDKVRSSKPDEAEAKRAVGDHEDRAREAEEKGYLGESPDPISREFYAQPEPSLEPKEDAELFDKLHKGDMRELPIADPVASAKAEREAKGSSAPASSPKPGGES